MLEYGRIAANRLHCKEKLPAMKAILMHEPGPPEVLGAEEVQTPDIGTAHDLLIRLHAAGVNPVDTKLRERGTYYPDRLPAILGCDGAGVVERVGSAVTRFRPGDAVYFCHGGIGAAPGTYAEYAVVDEHHVAAKPASLDFVHAAAVPLVLITAWEALHERAGITAGQRVLIHGGAGGVGHVAIQLAKRAGCEVITTVGSAEKAAFVRELGADEVVQYHEKDFVLATLAWAHAGVDVALDTVGGETLARTMAAMRHYGDLVTLLQPAPDIDWKEARQRNLRLGFELMLSPMLFGMQDALQEQADILARGAELIDRGELRIELHESFPLAEAAAAHAHLARSHPPGKVALRIAD